MSALAADSYVETEQALLGACLLNPEALDLIDGQVRPEDFAEPLHVMIFDAFQRARSEGRRISVGLVTALLGDHSKIRIMDGLSAGQYVARLASSATTVVNAPDYARVVSEAAGYRRLALLADELRSKASAGHLAGLPRELATEAIGALDSIAGVGGERRGTCSLEAALGSLGRDDQRHARGATTGLLALDNKLNGYVPGQLYVIAGRPGMGKSAYMCSSLRRTAQTGNGVAIFSLEMGADEIAARCASDALDRLTAPTFGAILRRQVSQADRADLEMVSDSMAGLPMLIEDTARLTFSEITAKARQAKAKFAASGVPLAVVCIDHMGLVTPSDRYRGNKVAEAGEVSGQARALAKELDCCVVLLCQLSREVERRDDKRPVMADLRWSGEIEQDAHVIGFLYREAYYLAQDQNVEPWRLQEARHKLEFLIRKNRNGETGDVSLWCSIGHSSIRDDL